MDNNKTVEEKTPFVDDENQYGVKIQPKPRAQKEIGVDVNNEFYNNIIEAGLQSKLDMSEIQSFTQASSNRNLIYDLLDTMCEDPTIAAVLETYAEDATEYNDNGRIVWCESPDSDITKLVTYFLDTMNIDKNIYKWVHSLCKYGDVYIRLYRESEYDDPIFHTDATEEKEKEVLNEDVKIVSYNKKDKYAHYVEMAPNPAEIFELTRFSKTCGYIRAETMSYNKTDNLVLPRYIYKFKQKDIEIFDAKTYVHGCLEDNSSRTPEEVDIFIDNDSEKADTGVSASYTVKRGQSLLYNVFKIWRELMLLENSILLNRVSKSSIVRVVGVEVGDMPKEKVQLQLQKVKQLIEQKTAIKESKAMSEYTDPGPIENNIYVPTHNGIGALTTSQIGGDVDVKSLADLDYFKNKYFGALRVPKQYFGDTDDSAGFNGGESLSLISARYAKMVKRIQNTMTQMITDMINLMLIDKGLDSYVNKFTIKMQPPTTSEERDRRENLSNKIAVVSDIMSLLTDIEDPVAKLKILKVLLSSVLIDEEVINILQEVIEKLESDEVAEDMDFDNENSDSIDSEPMDFGDNGPSFSGGNIGGEDTGEEESETGGEESLPSPEELGVDMTDSNNPDFD